MTPAAAKLLNLHDRSADANSGWRLYELQLALGRRVFGGLRRHKPSLSVGEPGPPSIFVDDERYPPERYRGGGSRFALSLN